MAARRKLSHFADKHGSLRSYIGGTTRNTLSVNPTPGLTETSFVVDPATGVFFTGPVISQTLTAAYDGTTTQTITLLPTGTDLYGTVVIETPSAAASSTAPLITSAATRQYVGGVSTDTLVVNPYPGLTDSTFVIYPVTATAYTGALALQTLTAGYNGLTTRRITLLPTGTDSLGTIVIESPSSAPTSASASSISSAPVITTRTYCCGTSTNTLSFYPYFGDTDPSLVVVPATTSYTGIASGTLTAAYDGSTTTTITLLPTDADDYGTIVVETPSSTFTPAPSSISLTSRPYIGATNTATLSINPYPGLTDTSFAIFPVTTGSFTGPLVSQTLTAALPGYAFADEQLLRHWITGVSFELLRFILVGEPARFFWHFVFLQLFDCQRHWKFLNANHAERIFPLVRDFQHPRTLNGPLARALYNLADLDDPEASSILSALLGLTSVDPSALSSAEVSIISAIEALSSRLPAASVSRILSDLLTPASASASTTGSESTPLSSTGLQTAPSTPSSAVSQSSQATTVTLTSFYSGVKPTSTTLSATRIGEPDTVLIEIPSPSATQGIGNFSTPPRTASIRRTLNNIPLARALYDLADLDDPEASSILSDLLGFTSIDPAALPSAEASIISAIQALSSRLPAASVSRILSDLLTPATVSAETTSTSAILTPSSAPGASATGPGASTGPVSAVTVTLLGSSNAPITTFTLPPTNSGDPETVVIETPPGYEPPSLLLRVSPR
ncbi:hypothetical protein IWX90DRAFT_500850 [Phyllosticta citrichinensis]|uniref:Uncharacterized protein n=1 Tax=Phyllosticta citrichinensis TaxID=1130410 RepID=A0ABR1Y1L8_9PEZI